MTRLFTSRHPAMTVLRIALLAMAGWWLVKNLALAQLPVSIEWPNTDFSKTSVNLDDITSGGPPKDGIPSIDDPKFVGIAAAREFVLQDEPVVSVGVADDHRAYPLSILIWHEIVNDVVGGKPVTVTFCPLCNATLVFERTVNGRVLDFGTTGRLRKSDMVMYDRQTESWWQQFTGVGIVGELYGVELTRVPASIVSFADFAAAHPGGKVLTRETGHRRNYGQNPYQGYDNIRNSPFLFFDPIDPRLPAMERVLNVSIGTRHKLYPFSALKPDAGGDATSTQAARTQTTQGLTVLNDAFAGTELVVFRKSGTLSVLDNSSIKASRRVASVTAYSRAVNGRTLEFDVGGNGFTDRQTGSTWNLLGQATAGPMKGVTLEPLDSGVHFAFAWLTFRPDSTIYRK